MKKLSIIITLIFGTISAKANDDGVDLITLLNPPIRGEMVSVSMTEVTFFDKLIIASRAMLVPEKLKGFFPGYAYEISPEKDRRCSEDGFLGGRYLLGPLSVVQKQRDEDKFFVGFKILARHYEGPEDTLIKNINLGTLCLWLRESAIKKSFVRTKNCIETQTECNEHRFFHPLKPLYLVTEVPIPLEGWDYFRVRDIY